MHGIVYNETLWAVFRDDTLRDILGGAHRCHTSRWMISSGRYLSWVSLVLLLCSPRLFSRYFGSYCHSWSVLCKDRFPTVAGNYASSIARWSRYGAKLRLYPKPQRMSATWIPHTQQPQMARPHDMLRPCQSPSIHTAIVSGDHMERESVSAPIADPAVVPAPVPTADAPAPGPVPGHCVVSDIAALLHPSFSRNRSLPRTVVLDRSHRVCSPSGASSQRARERSRPHTR